MSDTLTTAEALGAYADELTAQGFEPEQVERLVSQASIHLLRELGLSVKPPERPGRCGCGCICHPECCGCGCFCHRRADRS